jgi:hypothetical protein
MLIISCSFQINSTCYYLHANNYSHSYADVNSKVRKKIKDIHAARSLFRRTWPNVAKQYMFAGDDKTQLYIQMHSDHHVPMQHGHKTVTRRSWETTWFEAQRGAYTEGRLVAVVGQGHASTIGYLRYTDITQSTVGAALTKADLRQEGYTDWTDLMFRRKWYRDRGTKTPLSDDTLLYVLSFQFYSI